MLYVITGGAGFIGSHLTESLLADGHQVVVVDDFSTGSRRNLRNVANHPALEIVEMDVAADNPELARIIAHGDAVVHLAAAVGVDLVVRDPVRTLHSNVRGSENVLMLAAAAHKRIILASTSEVYGKSELNSFHETDDLRIGSPYHSRWGYACSKLLDEFYLMALVQAANLPGTVVRFFNTTGPRQTGRYGMVLPRFVGAALSGAPLEIYGDGGQSRCFCHVTDVVKAVRLLLDNPASIGEIYNIGSRELITISELAERVIARLNSKSKCVYIPYEEAYAKGFEDMRRRRPATEKLTRLTGWQPTHSLDDIIDDVARELRSQPAE